MQYDNFFWKKDLIYFGMQFGEKYFLEKKKFAAKVKNQNVWPKATSILEPSSISMTSILLIFILKSYFTIIFSF